MSEMAKFPYLTQRSGTRNLYYKRRVPDELRADDRPQQIWRSLKTSDWKNAKKTYAAQHAEIELLFNQWRREDGPPHLPPNTSLPSNHASSPGVTPLTPSLLRRLADTHYLNTFDADFQWRGTLWRKVLEDEVAFWNWNIIEHPIHDHDGEKLGGQSSTYFDYLMEEPELETIFLYSVFVARKKRLHKLRRQYKLGDTQACFPSATALLASQGVALSETDLARLLRKLLDVEIKALEDLCAGDETTFDGIVEHHANTPTSTEPHAPESQGEILSTLIEKYLDDTAREREWPRKTILRKRGELREFVEIAGDKPAASYRQADGVKFRDVQMALPANRQRDPFGGLSLIKAAEKAKNLKAAGEATALLNPTTIKDKIGTVSLFFEWIKSRDSSVVNPLAEQKIRISKKRHKLRYPWTVDELNRMFSAPLYVGCKSENQWRQPGEVVLRHSAKFWAPLISLFSGLRLGEIIQLQVSDVKQLEGITYFDVTPIAMDTQDEEAADIESDDEKSLKTPSSQRAIGVHKVLFDIGFADFLQSRRASGALRLFPEYERAMDDGSWSKQYSKYFKRFRDSIGVTRPGVKFHSLRHNVEDALRNARNVPKEIRDAIQGHGENGVSREYGTGYYVETLNLAIQKIHFEGLNLDHLIDNSANRR
jgi:integrase